jgi:hypothetical protein
VSSDLAKRNSPKKANKIPVSQAEKVDQELNEYSSGQEINELTWPSSLSLSTVSSLRISRCSWPPPSSSLSNQQPLVKSEEYNLPAQCRRRRKESHPPAKAEQARRTATTERMRSSRDGWEEEVGGAMNRRLSACGMVVVAWLLSSFYHSHSPQGSCLLYWVSGAPCSLRAILSVVLVFLKNQT